MIPSRLFACVILVLSVAACAADEPYKYGDGSLGYHISCGGTPFTGRDTCLGRADSMCDNGYTIVSESDPAYPHNEKLWDVSTHDVFVRCNK